MTLDALRGGALIVVLLTHFKRLPEGAQLLRGGFVALLFFFVLSGYLISSLLIREWNRFGTISLKAFYARRALRLLPPLLPVLGASVLFSKLFLSPEVTEKTIRGVGSTLGYFTNWVTSREFEGAGLLSHTWSLSLEEQFYVAYPLLLCVLLKRGANPRGIVAGLGIATVVLSLRTGARYAGPDDFLRSYFGPLERAPEILVGVAAGLLDESVPRFRGWVRRYATGLALIATAILGAAVLCASYHAIWVYRGGLLALALASGALVTAIANLERDGAAHLARLARVSGLAELGTVSYAVYLWHVVVLAGIDRLGATWGNPARLACYLLASVALGSLSYRYLESPALRLKRKFERVGLDERP